MVDGPKRTDPRVGGVLGGTYRLESVIGQGGMATIYRARHLHLGSVHAVKLLAPGHVSNPQVVERFLREGRVASRLDHPNILRVYDYDFEAGQPFMVMDLLRGETLRARLDRVKRLELVELLPIVRQLCEGLTAAHAGGIVHRDLKPENLFLCEVSDQLKILDFGVAKETTERASGGLTGSVAYLGTPNYMSPEQASGRAVEVDAQSDVWAIGVVAHEALTGSPPFTAESAVAVFHKILHQPLISASMKGADLPPAIDRVLSRACAKERSERYRTPSELWVDLMRALRSVEPEKLPEEETVADSEVPTVAAGLSAQHEGNELPAPAPLRIATELPTQLLRPPSATLKTPRIPRPRVRVLVGGGVGFVVAVVLFLGANPSDRMAEPRRVAVGTRDAAVEVRAPSRDDAGVRPAPKAVLIEAALEDDAAHARDRLVLLLGSLEGRARLCFEKVPEYNGTMKLRVTVRPGGRQLEAVTLSTGPLEIRACLEGLVDGARAPRVSREVVAERLFGSAADED